MSSDSNDEASNSECESSSPSSEASLDAPVFVPKHRRIGSATVSVNDELTQLDRIAKLRKEERKTFGAAVVNTYVEQMRRDDLSKRIGTTEDNVPDDADDPATFEQERQAWKIREIKRLYRDYGLDFGGAAEEDDLSGAEAT
jgi:hypothetical protein